MRKILFLMAVFAFAVAVPVYAADNVSGTWVLTMMGFQGEVNSFDMVITQDGKKLDITVTNSEFQAMMLSGTGTLKRSKIKFSLKGTNDPFEFNFEGKVTGKKMEGTREITDGRGGTVIFDFPSSDGEDKGIRGGDIRGGNMILDSPPGDSGSRPTVDEKENLNTWSAVMK